MYNICIGSKYIEGITSYRNKSLTNTVRSLHASVPLSICTSGNLGAGTRFCSDRYLERSDTSTLVMCSKQHGCEMCDLSGNRRTGAGLCFCFRLCLDRFPGPESRMFSGSEVRRSICDHNCCAASAQSKLSPISCVWSVDRHIVWNPWLDTLYEVRLSIVSCHRAKQVPRSTRSIWMRGLSLERVSPLSYSTTGIPVNFKSQLFSNDELCRYKLAIDPQTYTCNDDRNVLKWNIILFFLNIL